MFSWLLPTMSGLVLSISPGSVAAPVHISQAVLATPSTVRPFILDGRRWSCDGAICVGRSATRPVSQSPGRECRRFVRRIGAVVEYSQDGYLLTPEDVRQCNAVLGGV